LIIDHILFVDRNFADSENFSDYSAVHHTYLYPTEHSTGAAVPSNGTALHLVEHTNNSISYNEVHTTPEINSYSYLHLPKDEE
jgi:hypothetical protein